MKPIDVCCAILEERIGGTRYVWVAKKGKPSHLAGLWEFPGGKVEPGETPETAIVREIIEELNVNISVVRQLEPGVHDYGTHAVRLIPFVCVPATDRFPQPREHEALAMLPAASLPRLHWAAADVPVLEQYLNSRNPQ